MVICGEIVVERGTDERIIAPIDRVTGFSVENKMKSELRYIDSGASMQMTRREEWLRDFHRDKTDKNGR